MKKILLVSIAAILLCTRSWALTAIGGEAGGVIAGETTGCVATTKEYTMCKAGYYLGTSMVAGEGMTCKRCPSYKDENGTTAYGTGPSNNKGDVTTCYIPSGSTFSDTTGKGKYTGNCYYK